ncbi:hypothetical protein [Tersicoccus solisilvae]|nr:hypothetical protein [Tersicoccus solisilvae]
MADRRPGRPAGRGTEVPAVGSPMPWWTTTMIVLDLIWLAFTLLGTAVVFALASFVDPTWTWYLLIVLVIAAYAAFVTVPLSAVLVIVLIRQRRWPWLLVPALVIGAVVVGMIAVT